MNIYNILILCFSFYLIGCNETESEEVIPVESEEVIPVESEEVIPVESEEVIPVESEEVTPLPLDFRLHDISIDLSNNSLPLFHWDESQHADYYSVCSNNFNECNEIAKTENNIIHVDVGGPLNAMNNEYYIVAHNDRGKKLSNTEKINSHYINDLIKKIHPLNLDENDFFGSSIDVSSDGKTIVIGAYREDSSSLNVNGNQADNNLTDSGAVYIFQLVNNEWVQSYYIKPSNSDENDYFGWSVSLSDDASVLAIGAFGEDSSSNAINGNDEDNSLTNSGAAYIYRFDDGEWKQKAYIKSLNPDENDAFGYSVALNGNGSVLAIGSYREDSQSSGVNGDSSMNNARDSGAVYIYKFDSNEWTQEAYIKSSYVTRYDYFGYSLDLSKDGNVLAVGAIGNDSSSRGINGNEDNDDASGSGAVYLYRFNDNQWRQEAYIKASNTETDDMFGTSLSISGDGNTLAVGATEESSSSTGINGDEYNNHYYASGAVYLFQFVEEEWNQKAYIKSFNTEEDDYFGQSVDLSDDGNILAVSALGEDSNSLGINGDETNNSAIDSGAVYLYELDDEVWKNKAYIKSPDQVSKYSFGKKIILKDDGTELLISSPSDNSIYIY